jgi:hypothetical protein
VSFARSDRQPRARRTRIASVAERAPAPLVLVALCAIQLGIALWVALSATHNHFVWYSGGDATEYWTASWSLAHGEIGQSIISYGVPVLYAWVPFVTGTTLLGGLPVITVIQAAVFVPLALVLFWAVADLLFGRLFAWWAAVLWVVGPLLMLAGFTASYRADFKNLFLAPHWFGLTNMADMPSLVFVLATAWAALRLLERRTYLDAALTGLLAGALIGIKPANGFFLIALAIPLLAIRQIRPLLVAGAAFVPALVTLALWKERGLGKLPITSYAPAHEAAAVHPELADTNKYVQFDWSHLHGELLDLRDVFWSLRLLEFVAVAGIVAILRRSPVKGAFVAVWFAGFCLLKGSSEQSQIVTVSYWRFVEPGLPAFILLAAALVFLVPRSGRPFELPHRPSRVFGGRRTILFAAVVLALVPLLLVAVAQPAPAAHYVRSDQLANDAPLTTELHPIAAVHGRRVHLTWPPLRTGPTSSYYVVYRSGVNDGCELPDMGAKECGLQMDRVGITRTPSFDDTPGAGTFWYRIALMANYRDTLDGSDLMLLGPATKTTIAR